MEKRRYTVIAVGLGASEAGTDAPRGDRLERRGEPRAAQRERRDLGALVVRGEQLERCDVRASVPTDMVVGSSGLRHARTRFELARRATTKDPVAQRELFLEQRANVHRALFRILGSNREIEDLLQDAVSRWSRATVESRYGTDRPPAPPPYPDRNTGLHEPARRRDVGYRERRSARAQSALMGGSLRV
jgi:hypothetical protein